MLTLSRLSTALDLANSIYTRKMRYQLILLSAEGGTVYSACRLAVESHMAAKEMLLSLSSLFILENPGDSALSWDLHSTYSPQTELEHKVRYKGKLEINRPGDSSKLTFFKYLEQQNAPYLLSTFSQLIPKINFNKESALLLNDHIWSASGNWASIDLMLTIIEEESGTSAAMQLMKIVERLFNKYENNSQLAVLQNFSCHGNSERINISLRYIRENLRNEVTINKLAELANLSPRQFSRLFKEETGTSPAKAVAQIRAEVARQHVIQGRLSLDKISCLCGFSGTKSMRRAFLKFYGESPCNFRQK